MLLNWVPDTCRPGLCCHTGSAAGTALAFDLASENKQLVHIPDVSSDDLFVQSFVVTVGASGIVDVQMESFYVGEQLGLDPGLVRAKLTPHHLGAHVASWRLARVYGATNFNLSSVS